MLVTVSSSFRSGNINRITVEFKFALSASERSIPLFILIESQWNLNPERKVTRVQPVPY